MGTSSTSKFSEENLEAVWSSDGSNQMYSEEYLVSPVVCSDTDSSIPVLYSLDTAAAAAAEYIIIPSDWCNYLDGVLQNIGYCDYIAYGYTSEGVDNFILVYNLQIENDEIAASEYPYIHFTQFGSETGTVSELEIPYPCYGSFGTLSELREGGGIHETYTLLFAIGVSVVFGLACRFFDSYKHN